MVSKVKPIRLPDGLIERLVALAKSRGVTFSAMARFAMERGCVLYESEDDGRGGSAPRRRVLSRGVG